MSCGGLRHARGGAQALELLREDLAAAVAEEVRAVLRRVERRGARAVREGLERVRALRVLLARLVPGERRCLRTFFE